MKKAPHDSTTQQPNLSQTNMIQNIRNKMIVSLIETRSKNGYHFSHPSKLTVAIPLDVFEKKEIEFLRNHKNEFRHCDIAIDRDYIYPCYEMKENHLLTNEINLTSFR